jgi:hypothetical protein
MEFGLFAHKMLKFMLVSRWLVFRFKGPFSVFGSWQLAASSTAVTHTPPAPNFERKPNPLMKMREIYSVSVGIRLYFLCTA